MPWTVTKQVIPGIAIQTTTYGAAEEGTEVQGSFVHRLDHPTPQLGKAR